MTDEKRLTKIAAKIAKEGEKLRRYMWREFKRGRQVGSK